MKVFLSLEANQPNGASYRLAMGCDFHPSWASVVAALIKLL